MSKRRYFSPDKKVEILKAHLLEGRPVSDVCEEYEIRPGQFMRWQKRFLENGAEAFSSSSTRQQKAHKKKVERLRKQLAEKDEIIAEVAEAFITAKKSVGDL